MGNFSDSRGFDRGRRSFGGGRGGDRGDRPMFKAICSNCGKECEVPFRPTNGKPVYCSDCFEKMRGTRSDSPRPERSGFRPQGGGQNNNQFEALNAKLDRILRLLEPEKKLPEPEKKVLETKTSKPIVSNPVVLTPSVEKVIGETVVLKAPKVKPETIKVPAAKKVAKKAASKKK